MVTALQCWPWHTWGIVLCPWLRHFFLCLELVELRKSGKTSQNIWKTADLDFKYHYNTNKQQRSRIHTIKYHSRPSTPYGKVTKTQENSTYKRAKRSANPQQETTRQQGTDSLLRNTNKKGIHKRNTAFERSVTKLVEALNMFNGTNLTLISDVDQDT